MITPNEILGKKNIKQALLSIEKKIYNKNKYDELVEYFELNKDNIKNNILNNTYYPEIIQLKEILNYNGKKRLIANLELKDKLISRAVMQILDKYITPTLSPNNYSFVENKGTLGAIKKVKEYCEMGNTIVGKIDIQDFFNNINHDILMNKLDKYNIEESIKVLINNFLKCEVEFELLTSNKNKGLIQGNPMSPILSNIYLDDFDRTLIDHNINFVRYCDDITIMGNDKKEVIDNINFIERELENNYLLKLNNKKTIISNIFTTSILGYNLIKDKDQIEIIKKERLKGKYYNNWTRTSLISESGDYHIISDGILNHQEYSLLFENKDKKIYIPPEVINNINLYSNIVIGSNFFQTMNYKNISVTFYDKYNRYLGKFIPQSFRKSALTVLKQVSIYNDEPKRIKLAKEIVFGEIHNIKSNLKYYDRRFKLDIEDKIIKIENYEKKLKVSSKYSDILLHEARIRELYYSCFNKILKDDGFIFINRTKRPPKDAINALISFGNTLLYNHIANEIYKTTLDIRIAYLHSSNNRYESLNLDIADIFKPIIIDRIIFKLINMKRINSKIHFEKNGDGIYLNKDGKGIFIREFYNKLSDTITINNKKINYENIIRREVYKLMSSIRNDISFKAFKYY